MKSLFKFNKSQKIGVLSLCIIILILVIALRIPRNNFMEDAFDVDTTTLEYFEPKKISKEEKGPIVETGPEIKLEPFFPDLYTKADWMRIGFSEKQAKSIISFKDQIGGFRSSNDIKKVYVISETKLKELEPYMKFKTVTHDSIRSDEVSKKILDINTANRQGLIAINGIGEILAERIIKFRTKLGGFYNVKQLKEVYGLTEENYQLIMSSDLTADTSKLVPMDIKSSSFEKLKAHPYISWEVATLIVKEVEANDTLNSLDFLTKSDLVSKKDFERIRHYISIK